MADLWRRYRRPLVTALVFAIVGVVALLTRLPGSRAVAGACFVAAVVCLITLEHLVLRPDRSDDLSPEHPPE